MAPSGTVTFLFTDIEGSTRLWQADETAMRAALSRHDELLRKAVADHDGAGVLVDGRRYRRRVLVGFCGGGGALTAQRLLEAEAWPTATPIRVRMGIHTGEAERVTGTISARR